MADVEWDRYAAVLFDLDGVITPTALVHERAWKRAFDGFLARHEGPDFAPFSDDDYLAHVDGRPRYDGVRAFLASRGITLPEGEPTDPPGDGSVCALGNSKNELFRTVLREGGVDPYPGSVALLDHLDGLGVRMAVVSSSANAVDVLNAATLTARFETVVDGKVSRRLGLAGKPEPDTFLEAARRLGVAPAATVVVEDALSGVAAGRAGAFGMVIGVARSGDPAALLEAGADLVVDDLAAVVPV